MTSAPTADRAVKNIAFCRWLRQQVERDNPIGDLARDFVGDKRGVLQWFRAETWPNPSLNQLYTMLRFRFACSEALDALIEAYREWQQLGNTYRVTRDDRRIARSKGWYKLRFMVLKRDGYRCQLCGRNAQDGIKLEVDHKIAVVRGGTDELPNLWTLCFDCNRGKRDHDL